MRFKEFELDRFQEESIHAIEKGHSVMVSAPTGSGKTLIADYIIDRELPRKKQVIYTAPIKALSNQKFKDFTSEYGEDAIGLITGDTVINPSAQILIMTTEVYRNMAIVKDPLIDRVSYCIMDEIHFINDRERGYVWEESIVFSPDSVRFLFLSATVPNADEFASWVGKIKKHIVDVISSEYRPVPLDIKFYDVDLGITTLDRIKERKKLDNIPEYRSMYKKQNMRGNFKKARVKPPESAALVTELRKKDKLPCIYFVFSRAKTQDYALKLATKNDFLNKTEKTRVAEEVQLHFRKTSPDVQKLKSTKMLRQCLGKGVGFHHAGLLPDTKQIVEKLFAQGLLKVLFTTETFAVGINMPARTVCFDGLRKYTGEGFRYLNTKEFFQISGRAGRRGMDKSGLSVSMVHRPSADFKKIRDISTKDTMPIMSQFRLSYNTVLNMINLHTPQEIEKLLKMNFYTFQNVKAGFTIKARFKKASKILAKLGYIENNGLTPLGIFTTKIFSDELDMSQIFMTKPDIVFNEYNVLLLITAMSYEEKKEFKFYDKYVSKDVSALVRGLRNHEYLKKAKWLKYINRLTGIVQPIYEQKQFIDILKNTNMLEGDLMRLLQQMIDRLEQIDRAIIDNEEQRYIVRNCKRLIKDSLEGIGMY